MPQAKVAISPREMASSEVFRPSNGPLVVRGHIADGTSFNGLRKSDSALTPSRAGGRPSTQGGYRFGQLSHSSFFARHNPHPNRVRHLKGLLDIPICTVNDDGYFSNPRYSLQFPPNNYDTSRLGMYSKYYNVPANAINVNNQRYPVNTITGLQYFLGKPLNMRVFREKAVPQVGMVPVVEAWQDELRALTEAVHMGVNPTINKPPPLQEKAEEPRSRGAQYSAETGRLIPPPSRAMSRQSQRQAQRERFLNQFNHITDEANLENQVLQMLCQILQTDDVNAVQSWLVSAADREKEMVLHMLRAALAADSEYYRQYDAQEVKDVNGRAHTALPAIAEAQPAQPPIQNGDILGEASEKADRLTLDNVTPRPPSEPKPLLRPPSQPKPPSEQKPRSPYLEQRPASQRGQLGSSHGKDQLDDATKPPVTTDPFRPKTKGSDRPMSGLARPKTPGRSPPNSANNLSSEPKLRYTTTPIQHQNITSQKASLMDVLDPDCWSPEKAAVGP